MGEDLPQKTPTIPAKTSRASQLTRKERLAEELRANLKRRKAAARRSKADVGDEEDGDSGEEQ